ncbi:hypothetical protein SEA_SPEEDDEMON_1640 [Gordonia phage SpeedDemon]|nr:hypothetical protein SEA_SPEEDDEMON_1640 [Gordonia phage SpeedDemon]
MSTLTTAAKLDRLIYSGTDTDRYMHRIGKRHGEDTPVLDWSDPKADRIQDAIHRLCGYISVWDMETTHECEECNELIDMEYDRHVWGDGWIICADCAVEYVRKWGPEDDYVNNSDKALIDGAAQHLAIHGWEQYAPGDPIKFRNGWYGIEDSPADIAAEVERRMPDHDWVFAIDYAHMFEVGFTIWVKPREN